jgi:hypothetical protein
MNSLRCPVITSSIHDPNILSHADGARGISGALSNLTPAPDLISHLITIIQNKQTKPQRNGTAGETTGWHGRYLRAGRRAGTRIREPDPWPAPPQRCRARLLLLLAFWKLLDRSFGFEPLADESSLLSEMVVERRGRVLNSGGSGSRWPGRHESDLDQWETDAWSHGPIAGVSVLGQPRPSVTPIRRPGWPQTARSRAIGWGRVAVAGAAGLPLLRVVGNGLEPRPATSH